LDGASIASGVRWYEVLEPSTARVFARFTNTPDHSPAVTINRFGKGNAISPGDRIEGVRDRAGAELHLQNGGSRTRSQNSRRSYARVVDGRTLYVNTLLSRMTLEEKAAQMMCIWQQRRNSSTRTATSISKAKKAFRDRRGLGQVGRPSDAGGGKTRARWRS
jgi:hypothetical protein